MLKNIAPLGFNPAQHNRKPQKGNPLVSWLAQQEAAGGGGSKQQRPHSAQGRHLGIATDEDVPPWCRTDAAGLGSLKVITESFYTHQVQPVVQALLEACYLAKPVHVVPFACAHFTGEDSAAGALSAGRTLSWDQYEDQYIRPARLFLIQPLVHLLLQARPADVPAYVRRVFAVHATLMGALDKRDEANGGAGQFPSGQVPLQRIADLLSTLLWCVTDEELKLLNGVLAGINSEPAGGGGVHVVEFAIRVPLEISEKLRDAVVNGRPDPATQAPEEEEEEEDAQATGGDGSDETAATGAAAAAAARRRAGGTLSFRSIREETRLSRVREELDDVLRAARLAAAMPRTEDEDLCDECPEAAREVVQLRALVARLAAARPERADWMRDDLPQLHADLKLLAALPPRTRPGVAARAARGDDSSDSEDEDIGAETRALREIVERGAKICEVLRAGLGPVVERPSAGGQVDEVVAAARLQGALPRTALDEEVEEEYPEVYQEVMQLRNLVDRLAEAQPERKDWRRLDAPQLRSEIELLLALPVGAAATWAAFEDDFGAPNAVVQEAEQLRDFLRDGARVLAMLERQDSKAPQAARAAVATAQLFEALQAPSLEWLEQENAQALRTMEMLRDLVGKVAEAQLDRPTWVEGELKPLVSALQLQAALRSADQEAQVLDLEHDALEREYHQLNSILAAARDALGALVK